MNNDAQTAARTALAICCAALVGAMTLSAADSPSQNITAQATAKPDLAKDVGLLRQQVTRLEALLAELEKEELEKLEAADLEAEARDKKFEQRLAQLEKMPDSAARDTASQPVADGPATMRSITGALEKRMAALEQKLAGPLTVKAPFKVVDAAGKVVIEAGTFLDGRPNLMVGSRTAGSVELGVSALEAGFVRVGTATGKPGVGIGITTNLGMGVHVFSPDGEVVEGSLSVNEAGTGALSIGKSSKGGVRIGVGSTGTGYMTMRRPNGQFGLSVGQLEGKPFSLGLHSDNGTELVTLLTGPLGGTVLAKTPAGVNVAALLGGVNGGGLELTGPSGGKSALSLDVGPTGGRVRVSPPGGGKVHAELTADAAGGGLALYSKAGTASASLTTGGAGGGALELSRGGTVYVEAGIMTNGRGVVRAGPSTGGAIPAGGFADQIIGKIK